VNDSVGLCGTGAECLQISEITSVGDRTRCRERFCRALRASETAHAVAMAEEFGDNCGPDQARATCDEDVH
jgi:hypothetical protein